MSKEKNAAELFVEALENEGVEYIYGVPGEENLAFLEALRKSNITFILTRHEQSAGFMAATYGRLTGKTGVCLSTLGPGATNFVTAAAYAELGAMPMMMITGQKPIKRSKQGRFQIIDTVDMMRPLTKFTKQIVNGNTIPNLVREAFRLAEEERPGAVHLELPEDIASEPVTETIFERTITRRPDACPKAIEKAVGMIKEAKMPLLLVGAGANRKLVCKALSNFVDATGIPFFNTQMGKGVINENHPLYLGTAALSEGDYIHCAIERADLIINVGHDVVEKPPFFMTHNPDGSCPQKVIHINFLPASVDRVYFPQHSVIGEIATTLDKIAKKVGKVETHDFSYYEKVTKHIHEHITEHTDETKFPMIPQRLVADVRKIIPDNGIIALDNGIYKIWFARNYLAAEPNTVLLDNALATMGAGLPSAIEAARFYPDRRVMAICGDGGFMMNSQEMETAVRLGITLVVLILRDDAYGMIRWKQKQEGFEDYALQFNNPDFVTYANSYGAKGHTIKKTEEFVPLVDQCYKEGGVHLIDLPIDYSENQRVLIDELQEKVCLI